MIAKYIKTAEMTARNQTNAGLFYLFPKYFLRVIYVLPLLMLWRTLMSNGVETGMKLSQMLTYTFVSTLLSELLNITSPLTDWIFDGPIVSIYQRPMSVYGHVIAQTLGGTIPTLLLFSAPMALLSPLFGVSVVPESWWFIPSLFLCISLGFAVEFIFAGLLIRMINARWLVYSIRRAVTWLFSGSFIPFAVLPWGIGNVFQYLPLGSLGGATLAVFTGLTDPAKTVLVQLFWNALIWPAAVVTFKKAQERLVSQGG